MFIDKNVCAVITKSDVQLNSGMAQSYEFIQHLTLQELSLPGAHNSVMDRKARFSDLFESNIEKGQRKAG